MTTKRRIIAKRLTRTNGNPNDTLAGLIEPSLTKSEADAKRVTQASGSLVVTFDVTKLDSGKWKIVGRTNMPWIFGSGKETTVNLGEASKAIPRIMTACENVLGRVWDVPAGFDFDVVAVNLRYNRNTWRINESSPRFSDDDMISFARAERAKEIGRSVVSAGSSAARHIGGNIVRGVKIIAKRLTRTNPARPGRRETPPFVVACVDKVARRLAAERGSRTASREDISRAFAICVTSGRKSGQLTKTGPLRMTPKGAAKARTHRAKLTTERLEGYEEMLAGARQPRRVRVMENSLARGKR
jgi:hypothetical protein